MYFSFPYVHYLSDELETELLALIHKYFYHVKGSIIFKNSFTIGSFFKTKERMCDRHRSGIVYKYLCDDCNSSYVGSTAVQFLVRQCQHAGLSHRTFSSINSKMHSSIRNHCNNSDPCTFKTTNFSIIDQYSGPDDKYSSNLRTLESLYIRELKPDLNDRNSAIPLYI